MMIANVPAVWMGEALAHRVNMKWMRWVAAALFIVLGGLTLLAGDDAVRLPPAGPGRPGANDERPAPDERRPRESSRATFFSSA